MREGQEEATKERESRMVNVLKAIEDQILIRNKFVCFKKFWTVFAQLMNFNQKK